MTKIKFKSHDSFLYGRSFNNVLGYLLDEKTTWNEEFTTGPETRESQRIKRRPKQSRVNNRGDENRNLSQEEV